MAVCVPETSLPEGVTYSFKKADLIFSTYVDNLIKQIPIRIVSNLPKVVWGELNRSSPIGFDSELKLEFDNGFELYVKNV